MKIGNNTFSEEEWRWVIGYESRYKISDKGRVQSFLPRGGQTIRGIPQNEPQRIKKQVLSAGYPTVLLTHKNEHIPKWYRVHRLVLEAFLGPCPDKCEAIHKDGSRTNNHLSNLIWGTRSQNLSEYGFWNDKNPIEFKLSKEDVLKIRKAITNGKVIKTIADKYGVCTNTIRNIKSGVSWKGVV